MKKKDIIIIAAALVLALGLYLVSQIAGGKTATTVVVTVDGGKFCAVRLPSKIPMRSSRMTARSMSSRLKAAQSI